MMNDTIIIIVLYMGEYFLSLNQPRLNQKIEQNNKKQNPRHNLTKNGNRRNDNKKKSRDEAIIREQTWGTSSTEVRKSRHLMLALLLVANPPSGGRMV
jgi:hypothetical protein